MLIHNSNSCQFAHSSYRHMYVYIYIFTLSHNPQFTTKVEQMKTYKRHNSHAWDFVLFCIWFCLSFNPILFSWSYCFSFALIAARIFLTWAAKTHRQRKKKQRRRREKHKQLHKHTKWFMHFFILPNMCVKWLIAGVLPSSKEDITSRGWLKRLKIEINYVWIIFIFIKK